MTAKNRGSEKNSKFSNLCQLESLNNTVFCFVDSATDDYHLQVCVGDKDCIECNNFPSRNSLQWADSTCPEGTQGDTVRIVPDNDASHLRLCEVKITGRSTYIHLFSCSTHTKKHFWER